MLNPEIYRFCQSIRDRRNANIFKTKLCDYTERMTSHEDLDIIYTEHIQK